MTYNPANPEVKKALQDNWHLIKQERSLSPLHDTAVKVGFRRPPNLQDLLVKARLNGPTKSLAQTSGRINNSCFYTSNINCRYCPKMDRTGRIKSTVTGRSYTTPHGRGPAEAKQSSLPIHLQQMLQTICWGNQQKYKQMFLPTLV